MAVHEHPDPEIERAWADAAERRIAAHDRGETTSAPPKTDIQAGLSAGLRAVRERYGDAVSCVLPISATDRTPRNSAGGTISKFLNRRAIVSTSSTAYAQNLVDNTTQAASPLPPIAKPSVSLPSALDEEWMAAVLLNMKRMATDEAYRLEIAKRLS